MNRNLFRKRIYSTITILSLVLALTATAAMAQSPESCKINVPFSFNVGKYTLPAGEYTVRTVTDTSQFQKVLLASRDGHTNLIVQTLSTAGDKSGAKTQVNFNKYNNQYFLSSISNYKNGVELKFKKSKAEKMISQVTVNNEVVPLASE